MSKLNELIEWIETEEIVRLEHIKHQPHNAKLILEYLEYYLLPAIKSLQSEEQKMYTQEEMDEAKSEAWWEGWNAYRESL